MIWRQIQTTFLSRPRVNEWRLFGNSPVAHWRGHMLLNQDFRDLFVELNAHGVDFLVVGAHALAVHGHVRATKDLDVWVRPSAENAPRVMAALRSFGAATLAVTQADFEVPGITFQIGVEPVRIDIITAVDGVTFDPAWQNRIPAEYGDVPVFAISREDLIRNKLASGRPQDLADVEALERHKSEPPPNSR